MIFKNVNVDLQNYILLRIYISVVLFYISKSTHENNLFLFHDETRGCLFDMRGIKEDIIMCATKPKICYECETKLRNASLPIDFIDKIRREIKKIKKPLYYRIIDWIKVHPVLSIIITTIFTITINIIASMIYDIIKYYLIK